MTTVCKFPGCGKPSAGRRIGLCRGHLAQKRRHPGEPLRPLQEYRRGSPRVPVTVRVSPETATVVEQDRGGAADALERWARRH